MSYTSKVYIKANQTGLTTSNILENGFNSSGFEYDSTGKKKEYQDSNRIDGVVGEGAKVTVVNPVIANVIQIGAEEDLSRNVISKKGVFLEKPALTCSNDACFFPLGSSGNSLDISYKAEGFRYSEFLKGGVDETEGSDFYNQVIQEAPLTSGYKCSKGFLEESPYDEKCYYDFSGVHITSDTSKYKNILKFEQDTTSFSTEEKTLDFKKGDYLNYTCKSSRSAQQILSIEITKLEEDGSTSPYDNYIYDVGSIFWEEPFEEPTTLKLKLTFHSAFRRRIDSKLTSAGKDWTLGLFNSTLDGEDIPRDNFLQAKDAVIIPNKGGGTSLQFKKVINIPEIGKYYFSAYMRTEEGTAKVEEMNIVDGGGSKVGEYLSCADSDIKEDQNTFTLSPVWKRISVLIDMPLTGEFYLNLKITNENKIVPGVHVVGMEVVKNELPPYDYRNINYTNILDSNLMGTKKHVIYFDFSKAAGSMIKSSSWAISYLRKFEGLEEDNQAHYDTIGNVVFGYSGSNVMVNNEAAKGITKFTPNDSYNGWEQVIVTHTKDEDQIYVEVNTVGNCSKGEAPKNSKRYTFYAPISSYTLDMPYTNNGTYNLILGGKVENGEVINCNGSYRNLWWFPNGVTREEINKLRGQYLIYSLADRTKKDGSIENAILLRSDFLWETSTY